MAAVCLAWHAAHSGRLATREEAANVRCAVGDLRRFLPRGASGPQRYHVATGATVSDLLDVIGIEPDADLTVAVDNELAACDTPLRDGAEVMLLSPMEGGSTS